MITFARSHYRRHSTVMHATTPTPQPPQSCKVVIIGAGFAGLAAGTTLCNNFPQVSAIIDPDRQAHNFFCTEEVVILEASDRVGGRAHTLPISDTLSVELGCTWLHGLGTIEQPNPVWAVARAAGLMSSTPQPQIWWGSTFLLPGRKEELTKDEKILVHRAIEAYAAAIESIETKIKEKEGQQRNGTGVNDDQGGEKEEEVKVVGAALDAAWLTFLQDEQIQLHNHKNGRPSDKSNKGEATLELARAAWRWREQLQRAIDGCTSTHDVDAIARALYTEFGGSDVHAPIPCGYQKVAEALAAGPSSFSYLEEAPTACAPLNIKFKHEVELIEWGIDTRDNSPYVLVTCSNGARFKASAAIITTSLGVLQQRHESMFLPKLPEKKVHAIENLKIGVVDKIIIDFSGSHKKEGGEEEEDHNNDNIREESSRFGGRSNGGDDGEMFYEFLKADRGVVTYALLWEDKEEASSSEELPQWAKGIFSIRWGGPEFKRKGPEFRKRRGDGGEVEFDKGEEDEESHGNTDEFPTSLSLRPKYSQAVMWITGDAARSMEAASDIKVLKTIRAVFKKFPGIALPLEENGVDEDLLWKRVRIIRSQWGLNPFTAGSYSYVGPTGSPKDVAALAAPITKSIPSDDGVGEKPVLLFAGEACHVQYIGTTHAAYLTGKEAAELVLKEKSS